jgi:tight adherence protein B
MAFVLATFTAVAASALVIAVIDGSCRHRARRRLPPSASRRRGPLLVRLGPVGRVVDAHRGRVIDRDLAVWLDGASRSARAGASLRQALVDGAAPLDGRPIGPWLRPFTADLRRGVPLAEALDHLASPGGSRQRHLVWRALRIAADAGGPAAELLDGVAATLHERAALTREIRALATQARASALVLVTAPLVFSLVSAGADARVVDFLVSPIGLMCVVAGLALDGVGGWWMVRLVRGEP